MPERVDSRHGSASDRPHPRPAPERRTGPSPVPADPGAQTSERGPTSLVRLQRSAGNRAVATLIAGARPGMLQRVEVKDKPYSETLYDQAGAAGKAGAAKYSLTPAYVLTRNGDSGLTVKVRVQFLNQVRAADGSYSSEATEIPVNDPDDRRGWA